MGLVKRSVTIPEELYKESKRVGDNFSSLVTEALADYLKRRAIDKATESFGKWEPRDKESTEIANELRLEENREDHAKRTD